MHLSNHCSFSLPSIHPHSVDEERRAVGESRTAGGGKYNAAGIRWGFYFYLPIFCYYFSLSSDFCLLSLPSIPPHSVDEERRAAGESRTADGGKYNVERIRWGFYSFLPIFCYHFSSSSDLCLLPLPSISPHRPQSTAATVVPRQGTVDPSSADSVKQEREFYF